MRTLEVKAGNITIGGDNPIVVQTMCNTHTADVDASVAQCIGLAEAGEAIAKGDLLTASAAGTVQKAVSGNFIFGVAMTAAQEAGELVQIQITKSGYQK